MASAICAFEGCPYAALADSTFCRKHDRIEREGRAVSDHPPCSTWIRDLFLSQGGEMTDVFWQRMRTTWKSTYPMDATLREFRRLTADGYINSHTNAFDTVHLWVASMPDQELAEEELHEILVRMADHLKGRDGT